MMVVGTNFKVEGLAAVQGEGTTRTRRWGSCAHVQCAARGSVENRARRDSEREAGVTTGTESLLASRSY